MKNPFRFGGTLQPENIVNRQEEIAQVMQIIEDGEKLFLIGPRRYGKTTILHAARARCLEAEMQVLYFNAEAYTGLSELTASVFSAATAALVKPTQKAKTSLRDLFTRIKPTISIDLIEQKVSGSIDIAPDATPEQVPMLVDVLNGIEKLAQEHSKPVGIIIDEFQEIIRAGGEKAEGMIRAAIQDHHKIGYVFAGSRTRMLMDMTNDHARPFYRLGARRFLKELPAAEISTWLMEQFATGSFTTTEDTVQFLITTVEAVPYDIQKVAQACWSLLVNTRAKKLTPEIITAACQRLIEEDGDLYARAWNQLTSLQKLALLAVHQQNGAGLTTKAVLSPLNMNSSTMSRSLSALEEKGILRAEDLPNEVRWRFEDPLFRKWIHARPS